MSAFLACLMCRRFWPVLCVGVFGLSCVSAFLAILMCRGFWPVLCVGVFGLSYVSARFGRTLSVGGPRDPGPRDQGPGAKGPGTRARGPRDLKSTPGQAKAPNFQFF